MPSVGPATFETPRLAEGESFKPFSNPDHPGCFACNSQLMLVQPISVKRDFVLLEATTKVDDRFVVMPECWLVYPRKHVTSYEELPDYWTAYVKNAIRILRLEQPYCTSENWGRDAGQTVEHGHTWIIGRKWHEEGLLSEGLGLATILLRIKERAIKAS